MNSHCKNGGVFCCSSASLFADAVVNCMVPNSSAQDPAYVGVQVFVN